MPLQHLRFSLKFVLATAVALCKLLQALTLVTLVVPDCVARLCYRTAFSDVGMQITVCPTYRRLQFSPTSTSQSVLL